MNKLDIFIPTVNPNWDYLSNAIKSVQNQIDSRWTLTIIDGSHDEDLHVSQRLQQLTQGDINYIRNTGDRSIAGTWNLAFRSNQHRFIQLLHDDDFLEPNYVKQMLQLIEENPNHTLYFCSAQIVDKRNRPKFSLPDKVKGFIQPNGVNIELEGDKGMASLLRGCYIFCPTVIYDTKNIESPAFDSDWSMVLDLAHYFDILVHGKSIYGTDATLYNYRRHESNQTSKLNHSFKRFEEETRLYNLIHTKLSQKQWPITRVVAKRKSVIKLHLIYQFAISIFSFDFARLQRAYRTYKSVVKS